MITKSTRKHPKLRGLLLLDCWEPQVHDHFYKEKFYINLIEKLKNKNFEYIVNSASGLQIDLNDTAMATTIKVCDYDNNHPIIRNLFENSGNEKISTLLSKYLLNRIPTINILNDEDFVWFCTKYLPADHVQNWLVAGHTWQMCTHEAVLGLHTLARLTKTYPLNFYATDYSFCTMTEQTAILKDFEKDIMNWRLVEGFGYQLLPPTQFR
jgi:hypothetical protein